MLEELHVANLGVVEDLSLMLRVGLTAVTGETGAGKTMIVEAIRLLAGGRAEPHVVRTGAEEAWIEGRFIAGDNERVLARAVPTEGRSRAYIDGRMAPVGALSDAAEGLVDLHEQNAHQALLSPAAQRNGVDSFAGIDTGPLINAKKRLSEIESDLDKLGGDAQTRAREMDLLRFQLEELEAAELDDSREDETLLEEENLLAGAEAHRDAAAAVHHALSGDGGAIEMLAVGLKASAGRQPLAELEQRLRTLASELDDIALETSATAERLQDDPERLSWVQARRSVLKALGRKYGPSLVETIAFREQTRARLAELEHHDEIRTELDACRLQAATTLDECRRVVGLARRNAGPKLAKAVESHLHELALPHARFEVSIGDDLGGDDVEFLLGPNPGMPLLPVAKAASGGELARSMLALRLSLLGVAEDLDKSASTFIFDEVDAGIGGEAAVKVGQALSALASSTKHTQVFVVTHLPQVAAFADQQISVEKEQGESHTIARVHVLQDAEREVELARMLSGRPDSVSGRTHARELLDQAATVRKSPVRSPPVPKPSGPKKLEK